MYLKALYLHNFRLYEEAFFEFSSKVNILCGPNARGKTSLIEAIYVLITGHSFRSSQLSDLIRHGANYFYLDAHFIKHGIEQKIRVYYSNHERRVTHNTTTYSSLNSLLGIMQGVVIHPDDVSIVKGAPALRRQLLDGQLSQSDPLYVHHLTRYERAMRQRNHLLRLRSPLAIDSWEYEMANSAAYLVQQRFQAVETLQSQGRQHYHMICGGLEELRLNYKPHGLINNTCGDIERMRHLYRDQYLRHRQREMDLGATLTGPHKDDMTISLQEREARSYASEGQQRSCVAALRLAEWERLSLSAQEKPLMLVDDLGMSLDSSRRQHLICHLNTLDQVFVTTTEETVVHADQKIIGI